MKGTRDRERRTLKAKEREREIEKERKRERERKKRVNAIENEGKRAVRGRGVNEKVRHWLTTGGETNKKYVSQRRRSCSQSEREKRA